MGSKKGNILKQLQQTRQIKKSEFEKEMAQLNKSTANNKKEALANFRQNYYHFLLERKFII
jgi:hypothetical protein